MTEKAQQYKKGWRKKSSKVKKSLSPNSRNNGPRAHKITKWLQRKQTGQENLKEWSNKPIGIMRNKKKAKTSRRSLNKGISKSAWFKRPMNPKVKDVVIGLGSLKDLTKAHRNVRSRKDGMGEDTQRNKMGWGNPRCYKNWPNKNTRQCRKE